VSAAPLESTPSDNSGSDKAHIQTLLLRPSPINPNVQSDPKPPERIIFDDTEPEREQRSLSDKDKLPAHGHESHEHESCERDSHGHDSHEDLKNVSENTNDHKQDEHSHEEHHIEKSNDHDDDHHDHKRESDVSEIPAKADVKPKELVQPKDSIQPITSGEPTIVYAKKADEKRSAADSFETSHRIPHIDESERTFETSHHIPSHIEDERTKSIENAKVGQKSETQ